MHTVTGSQQDHKRWMHDTNAHVCQDSLLAQHRRASQLKCESVSVTTGSTKADGRDDRKDFERGGDTMWAGQAV